MRATVRLHPEQHLEPDPDRVVARLFLPSLEPPHVHRARDILARVLSLDAATVTAELSRIRDGFGPRHPDLDATLLANAAVVVPSGTELNAEQRLLVGAAFTDEYAVEGAALCNPGVVPHPDQSGVHEGQLRVAVSLRGIGEGHTSCIEFASAVLEGHEWTFEARPMPLHVGVPQPGPVPGALFEDLVRAGGEPDELTLAVLNTVADGVLGRDVETVLADLHPDLLLQPEAQLRVASLRRWATAAYTVTFPEHTRLEQRVLLPATDDESRGLEDARFTLFSDEDGTRTYRACYTAYDGVRVGNRLLVSPDLRHFSSYPLTGPGARNKGMALFPRTIGGVRFALSRADGTTIGVTASPDGFRWDEPVPIETPTQPWQVLHVGNASPPLETSAGWLVVTHAAGFLRSYSLGAILLDRDDPTRVIGRLTTPLLRPDVHAGYVPNIVFSCGAIVHSGTLFVPHGVGDRTIAVASVPVAELLAELVG
jgi:predicted GH43/DUF377 family glycosyl hydrolase